VKLLYKKPASGEKIMAKINIKINKIRLFSLVGIMMLAASPAVADPAETLKALLIEIAGWTAQDPEAMNMDMGNVKMTHAFRSYSKGEGKIDATIMVGSNAMMAGHSQPMALETTEVKATVSEIDGFTVARTFDKKEKSGYIRVHLAENSDTGAVFVLNFSAITEKEALETAKKFDWEKIQAQTARILNE
jgi:hypothetical protein